MRGGAAEACWAHNPEVGGSKPPPAIFFLITYKVVFKLKFYKDITKYKKFYIDLNILDIIQEYFIILLILYAPD